MVRPLMLGRNLALIALGAVLTAGLHRPQGVFAAEHGAALSQYDVTWRTPSRDSSGSMPLGNGDIGLNVWVEQDGDVLFYISKTDAWSENSRLLKLGRVRIAFTPNPFRRGLPFAQALKLQTGEIEIRAGASGSETVVTIWVDANRPVIRVEANGEQAFGARVALEVWRTRDSVIEGKKERERVYGLRDGPQGVTEHADTVLPVEADRIVWFHRNTESLWPSTMRLQGLDSLMTRLSDPLVNRTFGAAIQGEGFIRDGAAALKSTKPRRRQVLSIYPLTAQTPTAGDWLRQLEQQIACIEEIGIEAAWTTHRRWWEAFWDRSWIRVTDRSSDTWPALSSRPSEAFQVSQGYALQRFVNACGGRGGSPIKFNGSIFTVDAREPKEARDPDYRRWGGAYWFQNTRLAYWPMLAAGDFDCMQPLFRMYREALPLAQARTRLYYGHDGAAFPETIYFWGTYTNDNYGWDRTGKPIWQVENPFIRYYWSGGLELTAIMLDYYRHTGDDGFLKDTLLPLAGAIIRFYDLHYPRDDRRRILFKPAEALETWHTAVNPLPEIAGLKFVLTGMLGLPADRVAHAQRTAWQRLQRELPQLPAERGEAGTILLPAEEFSDRHNVENPELYAVFPYRLYGVGKPGLEIGRATFENRRYKGTGGWQQDAIQAAYLGLASVARTYIVDNFSTKDSGSRFPAFWGPNYDWIPDQDHGNVAMMALQAMLLQTDGRKILLLPAWAEEWDVEFKLCAPLRTTVEARYHAGKVDWLRVTPPDRTADVVGLAH